MAKHSIEERIEDWCKKTLDQCGTTYYTKTANINTEIENALKSAPSKKGGGGNNYPDIKCFIVTPDCRNIPVMIEVKGTKGDFIKLNEDGEIANTDKNGNPNFTNISKYAVNGAIHYADAIINFTDSYKEVIAIGVNGYPEGDNEIHEIGAYYVSKENMLIPKKIADYSDLSFLSPKNIKTFLLQIEELSLSPEEIEERKQAIENQIDKNLKHINQVMHDNLEIVVEKRVKLLAGLIMAGLGVENKVSPLKIEDLKGELGASSNDGAIVITKVRDFLDSKKLPDEKRNLIINELENVFLYSKLEVPVNGESKIKTVFSCIKKELLPFITSDLHNIDFTGRLFNVLNDWVKIPDGAENDVVLTPRYVTELMARLAQVNKDSFVWDYCLGSAGFLISAMNVMIEDVKKTISSPEEQLRKILQLKATQLLGIEKLPDIYMLAVLNMILMGDGSSNIIHGDSLQFDGNYEQGEKKGSQFPANVFLLNPPYSAPGKGFIFVEKALSRMKAGRAAILIQENAGSGNGLPYTKRILQHSSLVASIHMSDIFYGKAGVQTAIYVFDVGTPHNVNKLVKFIDFSNDGYTRQNRNKSSQATNLKDTDNAKARYKEIEKLVLYGKGKDDENLFYFTDCYFEDYISLEGNDWTVSQHRQIDTTPREEDFRSVVKDYLAFRVSTILKNGDCLGK